MKSRKWIFSLMQWSALIIIPPIYKLIGLDNDLTMVVLTSTTAIAGLYLGMNVISQKKGE